MRVLVVVAHPDDEVLGCGATLARHADEGDTAEVVVLGRGALSREGATPSDADELQRQAHEAARILGASGIRVLNLPDNRFDRMDLLDIVKQVEAEIHRVNPEVVYTHHAADLNIDHRRTFEAVVTACRPVEASGVRRILSFEIPSSTEWQSPTVPPGFLPNVFVDVTRTLERKLSAIGIYSGEIRSAPHPRSIEALTALACWRGASAGMKAAEAFVLVRQRI